MTVESLRTIANENKAFHAINELIALDTYGAIEIRIPG